MKLTQTVLLLCLSIIFLSTSCSSGATFWIDNPTDQAIEVSIDGKAPITVNAKEFKKMNNHLSLGEHTMKIANGEEIKFNLDKEHVILNPTLSTYILVLQESGVEIHSPQNDTIIEIDGKKYEGPFPIVSNAPFIYSGDTNYLINSLFKDEIEIHKTGTTVMKKLFRKDEFIEFYNKEYI